MKRVSQTCRARFLAFMTNGMNTWNEASDAGHPGRLVGTVGHEVATVHTDLGERVGWSVRAPAASQAFGSGSAVGPARMVSIYPRLQ